MKRTTVFLYENTECDLKALAQRQGRAVADLVREAIDEYVAREKGKARRPLRFLAIGRSGQRDTAERHEDIVFAGLDPHGGDVRPGTTATAKPTRARPRRRSSTAPARGSR